MQVARDGLTSATVQLDRGADPAAVLPTLADARDAPVMLDGAAGVAVDPPPLPWVPGLATPAGGAGQQ